MHDSLSKLFSCSPTSGLLPNGTIDAIEWLQKFKSFVTSPAILCLESLKGSHGDIISSLQTSVDIYFVVWC